MAIASASRANHSASEAQYLYKKVVKIYCKSNAARLLQRYIRSIRKIDILIPVLMPSLCIASYANDR
jgi:hypothetical protein